MGKSKREGMERFKTLDSLLREEVVTMPRPKSLQDKIEATRAVLPKCYIDKTNCDFLIKSLKSYRQEYDEKLKKWKDTPLHDWSSHMASAMGDFALFVRNGSYGMVPSFTGGIPSIVGVPTFPDQGRGIRR
jgi:hypothetical protein